MAAIFKMATKMWVFATILHCNCHYMLSNTLLTLQLIPCNAHQYTCQLLNAYWLDNITNMAAISKMATKKCVFATIVHNNFY